MAKQTNPFLTDGPWSFQEHWPARGHGPVFDLIQGHQQMARLWKDADQWRLVMRQNPEVAKSLALLLQTLAMLADRVHAVEKEGGGRFAISAESDTGEPVAGADAIRRLLDALKTKGDVPGKVTWGARAHDQETEDA